MERIGLRKSSGLTQKRMSPPSTAPPKLRVTMGCPACGHRAFMLSRCPQEALWVGLKCPNCRNIIHVRCAQLSAPDEMHPSNDLTHVLAAEQRGR